LNVFCQAGTPQRVDCLASRWEIALSVFPKDVTTHYRIGSRTKVSQSFVTSSALYQTSQPRRRQSTTHCMFYRLETDRYIGPPILSADIWPYENWPICEFELYNDNRCPILSAYRYYRSIFDFKH